MRMRCAGFVLAAMPLLLTGCGGGGVAVGYTAYDPYYGDYHPWDSEVVYYNQWEHEGHRHHHDYRRLKPAEQKEYWTWRQSHGPAHSGPPPAHVERPHGEHEHR